MAVKYFSDFSDEAGGEWHIVIHDQNYGGSSPVEFNVASDGFKLAYEATDTNRSQAVIPSTLEFTYLIQNGNDDALLSDIAGSAEGRFQVEVYYGGSSYSVGHLYWRGVMLADIAEIVDEGHPQEFTLLAIDDLAGLRDDDFNTGNSGYANVSTIVSNCLNRMRCWDITSEINRATAVSWYEAKDHADTFRDVWTHAQLNYAQFEDTDTFPATYMKTHEVLEGILSGFGSRVYWRPSIDSSVASGFVIDNINAQQYDQDLLTGYSINNSGTTAATTLTRQEINLNSTGVHRLRGFKKGYLNPLQKATRQFSYGSSPFIVDHEYSGTVDSDNFHDGSFAADLHPAPSVEYGSGDRVSLRFRAVFTNTAGSTSSSAFNTTTERAGRFKISAVFRVGQYYADRNLNIQGTTNTWVAPQGHYCPVVSFTEEEASWETTSVNNALEWYTPPIVWTEAATHTFNMGIDMPPLPADLSSETCTITFNITPVDSDGLEATHVTSIGNLYNENAPQILKVTMYPTDIFESAGETVTFKAENDNSDAREILNLPKVFFSDKLGTKGGGLFLYSGSTRSQPSDWQSATNSAANINLHNLVTREWVQGQSRNIKKIGGEVRDSRTGSTNGITLLDTITHSSESYSIHGLEFEAKRGIYRLDCLLLENAGTVTNPTEEFSGEFDNSINTPTRPPVSPVTDVIVGDIQQKTDFITITQAVDLDAVESGVSTNSTAITEIHRVLKATDGGGGKGLYADNGKGTTSSYMGLSSVGAIMQAGANTNVDLSESSPGTIDLNVQAGASGSETQVTAITIAGDGAAQAARITMNEPVTFASTVSGVSLDEMSDVDTSGKSTGQVLQWGGSSWGAATVSGGGGSSDVVDDTSPQLGGNLDLNSNVITGTGDISITGNITASGAVSAIGNLTTLGNISAQGTLGVTGNTNLGTVNVSNKLTTPAIDFSGLGGTSTVGISTVGGGSPSDLELQSNGNVTIVLDDDDDETDQAFKIQSGDGTVIFQVNESGVTSGLLTTITPTISTISNFESTQTGTITVSNYDSDTTYSVKLYNSSDVLQSHTITDNEDGTWTIASGLSVGTDYYVTVQAQKIGEFISALATSDDFDSEAAATQQRYWRLQFTDSSKNAVSSKGAVGDFRLFTGSSATGTEYPTQDATSETSIPGVTITKGHENSSTYAAWKAFDVHKNVSAPNNMISGLWWTLGNSVAANNWVQIDLGSSINMGSARLRYFPQYTDATTAVLYGSNTGAFSGEEREMAVFSNVNSGSSAAEITEDIT